MKQRLKNMLRYFLDLKLIKKLLLSYFILIIVPMVLITYMFYNFVTGFTVNHITYSAEQSFEQTYSFLSYKLYNIKETSNVLIKNRNITNILKSDFGSFDIIFDIQNMYTLQEYLTTLQDETNVSRVRLYVPEGRLYSNENLNLFNINRIKNAVWYNMLKQSGKLYLWAASSYLEPEDPDNNPILRTPNAKAVEVLSLAQIIQDPNNYSISIGALRFDFLKDSIVRILNKANIINNSLSYIQNSRGDIIATSSDSLCKKYSISRTLATDLANSANNLIRHQFGGEVSLVGCRLLENTDWYMITVIPFGEILSESKKIRNDMLIIVLVIGTIAYILTYLISYSFTKRISFLAKKMIGVHTGKLEIIDIPPSSDEIGMLISDYNFMAKRMSALVEEQYKSGQELKSAELKALQAQINPHFLYNTLDMINWYARKNKGQEIVQIVDALARFYKLSLNKGKDIVSIRDEIMHVLCYFQIQSLRFKNSLNLHMQIDEEIYEYSIQKITLQPIVENSILHGILCRESKSGTITITGKLERDTVILKVEDDGIGIPKDKLDNILGNRTESAEGSGFGISNINKRLKIYYGEEYGLTYRSEYGKGTTVVILFPAIKIEPL